MSYFSQNNVIINMLLCLDLNYSYVIFHIFYVTADLLTNSTYSNYN